MGYEGKKVLRLKFEDPDLDGLEVVVRKPTVEQAMTIAKRRDQLDDDDAAGMFRVVAEVFCELLVGWNLENDGVEVPKTADAFLAQDVDIVKAIVDAWEDNAIKVPPPLEATSNGGETSVAESIPMEPLSPSLAS